MKVRWIVPIASLVLATTATAMGATSAAADGGPTFVVMNTSEQPPDGVWFRNSPHQNDTNRETGFGVYMNESLQVACYAWGDPVGPYNNHIWYLGTNVTRPTVNGHSNTGYMNTHYVNDGMTADHAYPGIPVCGAPPPPAPAQIYYSPYNSGDAGHRLVDQSVKTVYRSEWVTGTCGVSAPAYNAAMSKLVAGQSVGTLSGWSVGRTGPAYFLENSSSAQIAAVSYIILIDPGTYGELSCDRAIGAGGILANWLFVNRGAHLVVISSSQVSQQQSSKGIQETYFNAIRNLQGSTGVDLRSRVLTCNYTFTHEDAFQSAQYWIAHQIGTTTCPTLRDNNGSFGPTAAWHP